MFPKVARASQPWALRRNPVGIRKPAVILNEIDTVLAGHYGFTAEELDFILNYDTCLRRGFRLHQDSGGQVGRQVKYRFGGAAESEEE